MSGDAVDPATVNFHTIVFALSANQAIARIRAEGGRDYVQYFTWEVAGSLLALSALAEELGEELSAPSVVQDESPEVLGDSLRSALELWESPTDPYERSLAMDLVAHMRLVLIRGRELDDEYLDDVASLVGRHATSAPDADADLERFIWDAGPEQDRDILKVLVRRARRQRLLIPAMSAESAAPGAVGPHIDKCYLAPMSSLIH